MPDDHSSNLTRCSNIKKGSIHGMKSHDYHVFIETLFFISFSSLPIHMLNHLIEISHFLKKLGSTTLKKDSPRRLEENIPLNLCKLESHRFLDSMEDFPIHIPYEAWLGGSVRSLYPHIHYRFILILNNLLFIYLYTFMGNQNVM